MNLLEDFAAKDFIARVLILDEIETGRRTDLIPGLFAIFTGPGLDDAAQHAVGDTLRGLLAQSESDVVRGLSCGDRPIEALCVQVAQANPNPAFAPALRDLAAREADPDFLLQILSALAPHRSAEALELYRRFASHPDVFVSALSVTQLGRYQDAKALPLLRGLVEASEAEGQFETCTVTTEKAIEALAGLATDEALSFLVAKLHHRNPTARRFLHEKIVEAGARSVGLLTAVFERGDADERILAANLLGVIGGKEAGNVLVAAFDRGTLKDPNLRFAVYEALGQIPSLKGVVCLTDGLGEDDDAILMAVVAGLDRQLNPGVVARVKAEMRAGEERRSKVARAIAVSRALELFASVYEDPRAAEAVLAEVTASADPEVTAAFRGRLEGLGTGRADDDARRLGGSAAPRGGRRLLAVDDSKSMLLFYRSVGAGLDLDVITAANGKEALDLLDGGEAFDLIITDLNMPVMDGIEFTRRVRSHLFGEGIPVLMATTESEGSQRELAASAGVNGFLNKPIRPEVLQEAVRRHL
jgi:CheY-like chemotaxis protein